MVVEGRRFSTIAKVQMFGDHHQNWHQNLMVILFHNCGSFIPTYILNDALQPLKPWIKLNNTHYV
jgi:hypothetical protein